MTVEKMMHDEAVAHMARRDFKHKRWLKRQEDFQKIRERDCYGYKKARKERMNDQL